MNQNPSFELSNAIFGKVSKSGGRSKNKTSVETHVIKLGVFLYKKWDTIIVSSLVSDADAHT